MKYVNLKMKIYRLQLDFMVMIYSRKSNIKRLHFYSARHLEHFKKYFWSFFKPILLMQEMDFKFISIHG